MEEPSTSQQPSDWTEIQDFFINNNCWKTTSVFHAGKDKIRFIQKNAGDINTVLQEESVTLKLPTSDNLSFSCPICPRQIERTNKSHAKAKFYKKVRNHVAQHVKELNSEDLTESDKVVCVICEKKVRQKHLESHYSIKHPEDEMQKSLVETRQETLQVLEKFIEKLNHLIRPQREVVTVVQVEDLSEKSHFKAISSNLKIKKFHQMIENDWDEDRSLKSLCQMRYRDNPGCPPFVWICGLCPYGSAIEFPHVFKNHISARMYALRHLTSYHGDEEELEKRISKEWKILSKATEADLSDYKEVNKKILLKYRNVFFYVEQYADKNANVIAEMMRLSKTTFAVSEAVLCLVCFNPVKDRQLKAHFQGECGHACLHANDEVWTEFRRVPEIAEANPLNAETFPFDLLRFSSLFKVQELGDTDSCEFFKWRCLLPCSERLHLDDVLEFPSLRLLRLFVLRHFETFHPKIFKTQFLDFEWSNLKNKLSVPEFDLRTYSVLNEGTPFGPIELDDPNDFALILKKSILPKHPSVTEFKICSFCYWCGPPELFLEHITLHGYLKCGKELHKNASIRDAQPVHKKKYVSEEVPEMPHSILGKQGKIYLQKLKEHNDSPQQKSPLCLASTSDTIEPCPSRREIEISKLEKRKSAEFIQEEQKIAMGKKKEEKVASRRETELKLLLEEPEMEQNREKKEPAKDLEETRDDAVEKTEIANLSDSKPPPQEKQQQPVDPEDAAIEAQIDTLSDPESQPTLRDVLEKASKLPVDCQHHHQHQQEQQHQQQDFEDNQSDISAISLSDPGDLSILTCTFGAPRTPVVDTTTTTTTTTILEVVVEKTIDEDVESTISIPVEQVVEEKNDEDTNDTFGSTAYLRRPRQAAKSALESFKRNSMALKAQKDLEREEEDLFSTSSSSEEDSASDTEKILEKEIKKLISVDSDDEEEEHIGGETTEDDELEILGVRRGKDQDSRSRRSSTTVTNPTLVHTNTESTADVLDSDAITDTEQLGKVVNEIDAKKLSREETAKANFIWTGEAPPEPSVEEIRVLEKMQLARCMVCRHTPMIKMPAGATHDNGLVEMYVLAHFVLRHSDLPIVADILDRKRYIVATDALAPPVPFLLDVKNVLTCSCCCTFQTIRFSLLQQHFDRCKSPNFVATPKASSVRNRKVTDLPSTSCPLEACNRAWRSSIRYSNEVGQVVHCLQAHTFSKEAFQTISQISQQHDIPNQFPFIDVEKSFATSIETNKSTFMCSKCEFSTATMTELVQHSARYHEIKSRCPLDCKQFRSSWKCDSLMVEKTLHILSKHDLNSEPEAVKWLQENAKQLKQAIAQEQLMLFDLEKSIKVSMVNSSPLVVCMDCKTAVVTNKFLSHRRALCAAKPSQNALAQIASIKRSKDVMLSKKNAESVPEDDERDSGDDPVKKEKDDDVCPKAAVNGKVICHICCRLLSAAVGPEVSLAVHLIKQHNSTNKIEEFISNTDFYKTSHSLPFVDLEKSLEHHQKKKDTVTELRLFCSICDKTFGHMGIKAHATCHATVVKNWNMESEEECDHCSMKIPSYETVSTDTMRIIHLLTSHAQETDLLEDSLATLSPTTPFKYPYIDMSASVERTKLEEKTVFCCTKCPEESSNFLAFTHHVEKCHTDKPEKKTKKDYGNGATCPICSKYIRTTAHQRSVALMSHLLTVHNSKLGWEVVKPMEKKLATTYPFIDAKRSFETKMFCCSLCPDIFFVQLRSLSQHCSKHHAKEWRESEVGSISRQYADLESVHDSQQTVNSDSDPDFVVPTPSKVNQSGTFPIFSTPRRPRRVGFVKEEKMMVDERESVEVLETTPTAKRRKIEEESTSDDEFETIPPSTVHLPPPQQEQQQQEEKKKTANSTSTQVENVPSSQDAQLTHIPSEKVPNWLQFNSANRIVPSRVATAIRPSNTESSYKNLGTLMDALTNSTPPPPPSHNRGSLLSLLPSTTVIEQSADAKEPVDVSHVPGINGFRCAHCTFVGLKATEVSRHTMLKHSALGKLKKPFRQNIFSMCIVCKQVLPSREKLFTHISSCHPDHEKPYGCSFCEDNFSSTLRLREHERRRHIQGEEVTMESLECSKCPKVFTNLRNKRAHEERHLKQSSTNINH